MKPDPAPALSPAVEQRLATLRILIKQNKVTDRNQLTEWVRIGTELLGLKEDCKHGDFQRHVAGLDFSERKAQYCMQLARHKAEIASCRFVQEALDLIGEATPKTQSLRELPHTAKEDTETEVVETRPPPTTNRSRNGSREPGSDDKGEKPTGGREIAKYEHSAFTEHLGRANAMLDVFCLENGFTDDRGRPLHPRIEGVRRKLSEAAKDMELCRKELK